MWSHVRDFVHSDRVLSKLFHASRRTAEKAMCQVLNWSLFSLTEGRTQNMLWGYSTTPQWESIMRPPLVWIKMRMLVMFSWISMLMHVVQDTLLATAFTTNPHICWRTLLLKFISLCSKGFRSCDQRCYQLRPSLFRHHSLRLHLHMLAGQGHNSNKVRDDIYCWCWLHVCTNEEAAVCLPDCLADGLLFQPPLCRMQHKNISMWSWLSR